MQLHALHSIKGGMVSTSLASRGQQVGVPGSTSTTLIFFLLAESNEVSTNSLRELSLLGRNFLFYFTTFIGTVVGACFI